MDKNMSGSLGGAIDEMLQGSIAGNIKLLGGKGNLIDLSVNENGTYEPSGDVDGYKKVVVEVPEPVLDDISITENGTYTPPTGVDGYNSVEVNVPVPPSPVLTTLSITENGTYTPPTGVDGYNSVEVNVPSIKYILYAEQTATESNWVQGVIPLDTINYHDNTYFQYDSTNKRLIALKSFNALITAWGYNLKSSSGYGIMSTRKNGSEINSYRIPNSSGGINGFNELLSITVGDYIDITNNDNTGWAFGRIKIYDVGSSSYSEYEE